MNACTVQDAISIQASPEQVFKALTEGPRLAAWWPKSAESEPRPGGALTLVWFNDSTMKTRFDTFVEHREVGYAFYTEHLRFTLAPNGEGTDLAIEHRCDKDAEVHVAQSWGFLKANLKVYLELGKDLR